MSNLSQIFTALKTYLGGVSQVAALVDDRIYAVEVPGETVSPFIVMDRVSKASETLLSGERAGLAEGTFVFSCSGPDHADVTVLQEVLELALGGLLGTYDGVEFQGCAFASAEKILWLDDRNLWEGPVFLDLSWREAKSYG